MKKIHTTDKKIAADNAVQGATKAREDQFRLKSNQIVVSGVHKQFRVGDQDVQVLKGIDITINKGEFVIVFGPSGCGKSTLLHLILGLEDPTSGSIDFMGVTLNDKQEEDFTSTFRKINIGIVHQQPLWVKSLSVRENVALPLMLSGENKNVALNKSINMLQQVNMLNWADYFPTELSAGQQQRVAMARALVTDPEVIVADEPTGNLDFESGKNILGLFYDLNHNLGKTIILVTHDLEYLIYADKAFQMLDGLVTEVYDKAGIEGLFKDNLKLKKNGHEENGTAK